MSKRTEAELLAELESEERWNDLFSKSQDFLTELAEEVLAEHYAGKTQSIKCDRKCEKN